MTCEQITTLLARRAAGRLAPTDAAAIDEHLAGCASCRDAATAQGEVASVLASREDAPVDPAFASRVTARLTEEAGWLGLADWRSVSMRLAPVAALLLIIAAVVIGRQPSTAQNVSLSGVVETWATSTGESDRVPVTSVLWQP